MNFINSLSYKTLGIASCVGLTGCVWLAYKLKLKEFESLKQTECYKEAIFALRNHRGAVKYLGDPIKDGKVILRKVDELNDRTRLSEVTVEVAGPKNFGVLYFWVKQKLDEPGNAFLSEVQLQIGKDENKRLVVKETSDVFQ